MSKWCEWRRLSEIPPDAQSVRNGDVLVRRQWNTQGTVLKRHYEYKVLEPNFTVERTVSRGWLEYMEIPE
jgi:hypothetical protein